MSRAQDFINDYEGQPLLRVHSHYRYPCGGGPVVGGGKPKKKKKDKFHCCLKKREEFFINFSELRSVFKFRQRLNKFTPILQGNHYGTNSK